jgi:hypothetical protein
MQPNRKNAAHHIFIVGKKYAKECRKMANNGPFNPFDFNWESFEKNFGIKMPPIGRGQNSANPNWVENYVQDILSQVMPSQMMQPQQRRQSGLNEQVFETHDFVVARVPIPESADPYNVRVFLINNHTLRIEGLEGVPNHSIQLPVSVRPNGTKASYKNRVLEIRMPKESGEEIRKEINVRFY